MKRRAAMPAAPRRGAAVCMAAPPLDELEEAEPLALEAEERAEEVVELPLDWAEDWAEDWAAD